MNDIKIIDLHTHTDSSQDGNHPVDLMAQTAYENGIQTVAFTDHCEVDVLFSAGFDYDLIVINNKIRVDAQVGKIHGAYTCLAEGTYTAADSSVVFPEEKLCEFKFFFSHSAPPGHSV
jgi:histidinol phosphatase-like PHP family hydrolase